MEIKNSFSVEVKTVLANTGHPDFCEYYVEAGIDDIFAIREDVQCELISEGREDDDSMNAYGDACLSALNFLYDIAEAKS